MTAGGEQTLERAAEVPAYRGHRAEVVRTARLSPSFLRVTFGGEDLAGFADKGFDQRIKVILPLPDGSITRWATETTGTSGGGRSPRSCATRSAPTPRGPCGPSCASSTSTSSCTARPAPPPGGRPASPR